jgi:hypothetical protein
MRRRNLDCQQHAKAGPASCIKFDPLHDHSPGRKEGWNLNDDPLSDPPEGNISPFERDTLRREKNRRAHDLRNGQENTAGAYNILCFPATGFSGT